MEVGLMKLKKMKLKMSDMSVRKHGRRVSPVWDYFKLNYESGSLQANASEKFKFKLKFY